MGSSRISGSAWCQWPDVLYLPGQGHQPLSGISLPMDFQLLSVPFPSVFSWGSCCFTPWKIGISNQHSLPGIFSGMGAGIAIPEFPSLWEREEAEHYNFYFSLFIFFLLHSVFLFYMCRFFFLLYSSSAWKFMEGKQQQVSCTSKVN